MPKKNENMMNRDCLKTALDNTLHGNYFIKNGMH